MEQYVCQELTEDHKTEIREAYKLYLEAEGITVNGFGKDLPKPYIDRTEKEKKAIRKKYKHWEWNESLLETWLQIRPELSDPNFSGVFVDGDVPITDNKVREWFESFLAAHDKVFVEEARGCMDYMEQTGRVNNHYQEGNAFNSRSALSGWAYAIACMSEAQLSEQASTELRLQTEETQFAATISSNLYDCALEMKKIAAEMRYLDAAYASVMLGRKVMDVEFQDGDGAFKQICSFGHKLNSPSNRKYYEEKKEEDKKIREAGRERLALDYDKWKAETDTLISAWEVETGLPSGCLAADSITDDEHF